MHENDVTKCLLFLSYLDFLDSKACAETHLRRTPGRTPSPAVVSPYLFLEIAIVS
jgi:hypothetical protein